MSIAGELIGSVSGVVRVARHALHDGDVVNVTLSAFTHRSLKSKTFAMNSTAMLKYNVPRDSDCEFSGSIESSNADATAHVAFNGPSYAVDVSGSGSGSGSENAFKHRFKLPSFVPQLCTHMLADGQTRTPVRRPSKAPVAAPTLRPTSSARPTAFTSAGEPTAVPSIRNTAAPSTREYFCFLNCIGPVYR